MHHITPTPAIVIPDVPRHRLGWVSDVGHIGGLRSMMLPLELVDKHETVKYAISTTPGVTRLSRVGPGRTDFRGSIAAGVDQSDEDSHPRADAPGSRPSADVRRDGCCPLPSALLIPGDAAAAQGQGQGAEATAQPRPSPTPPPRGPVPRPAVGVCGPRSLTEARALSVSRGDRSIPVMPKQDTTGRTIQRGRGRDGHPDRRTSVASCTDGYAAASKS